MAAAPNPHELLRSTTGKANFQRIARLLIVGGTAVMREIFENNLPAATLSEALSNPATERLLRAKLNKQQLNCVYPSPGVCGNSEDFDISLFFQLLITVCKLIPSGTSFEDLTSTTDNSLARNLLRIKIFRNQVAHVNQNMEISNDDFPSLWQNISNAILEIAAHISPAKKTEWQDAIDDFLSRPLTPEAEKYEQELMTCYQSIEDLKTRVEELQEAVARFEALSSRPDNQPFGVTIEVKIDVEFKEYRLEPNQSLDAVAGHDQVPRDHRSDESIMASIAENYLETSPPRNEEERTDFLTYLREMRQVIYEGHKKGSLVITVRCVSLKVLEELWEDYKTGHLGEVVQKCFVTRELLEDLNLTELRLQTTVKEEEYKKAKAYFEKGRAESEVVSSISGEMDQVRDKAIPLCLPANIKWNAKTGEIQKLKGARGDFYVVEEAFAELRKIKEPICVVAITGPYRCGKSFILSETFDQDEVFPVGHAMDPATVGLWIWILPWEMQDINGCKYRVVLLDSEGTDACSAEEHNDNQMFVLTILLASLLIYNSLGVPKRSDLQDLDFIAKISHQIKVSSTVGSLRNEDAFHKTLPHFIWLFRDVMTQIPEEFEGIKDYLLKRVFKPNISKIDEPQDAIAEGILKYFSGFDAFSLPLPTIKRGALLDLKKKNLLNPDFLTGIKQFGELLKSKMGPKRSFNAGEFVTGEGMAFLTKLYVDAINDPFCIPNVQIAWETFVRTKCESAKEKAVLAYKRKMETDLSKLPRGASEILASHESAFSESMEIFEKETAGISYESTRMDREELTKEEAEQLSFWKAENDKVTQESCSTLLKELRQKHLDPVLSQLHGPSGTSISFEDIDNACAQIEQDYKDVAFGAKDVCTDVFHEFHQSLEAEMGSYEMMIKNLKHYEETLLKQRRENAQKEKETEEERELAKYLEKQLELQEQKFKVFEKEKEKELLHKIQEFQWQEENLKTKVRDIEAAGMEKRIEMESKLREANNEKEILQRQVKNLKQEMERMAVKLDRLSQPWYKKIFKRKK